MKKRLRDIEFLKSLQKDWHLATSPDNLALVASRICRTRRFPRPESS